MKPLRHQRCCGPRAVALSVLLAATGLFASPSSATLYKGYDEEGNVVYSDTPFPEASAIRLPSISTIESHRPETGTARPARQQKEAETATPTVYRQLAIDQPQNGQTFWNQDRITITLKLSPGLDTQAGDATSILLDGLPVVKRSQATTLSLTILDRGSHTLQAAVRNRRGKVVKLSRPVTIHIKRHFLKPKKTATP